MTKDNSHPERVSRQEMLAGTTLALGIGATSAAVGRASVQTKVSQAAAK